MVNLLKVNQKVLKHRNQKVTNAKQALTNEKSLNV